MQPTATEANDRAPIRRPWYRLHVSTYLMVVATAAVLLVLNLSHEGRMTGDDSWNHRGYPVDIGWPYVYRTLQGDDRLSSIVPASQTPVLWPWVAADVVIGILTVGFVGGAWEIWRRQHRSPWQFHLYDLLFVTILVAAAFGWLAQRRREASLNATLLEKVPGLVAEYEGARPQAVWRRWHSWTNWLDLGVVETQYVAYLRAAPYRGASDEPPRISDDDLQLLPSFRRLRILKLPNHESAAGPWPVVILTDAGLEPLGQLRSLEYLSLPDHPGITDAGLPHLAQLKRLKFLNLRGTSVTPAGIAKLRQQLPHATIEGP